MTVPASEWMLQVLVCPADRGALTGDGRQLRCRCGRTYPVVGGVPVLLLDRPDHTHVYSEQTLQRIRATPSLIQGEDQPLAPDVVDPFVQDEIERTNGLLYSPLKHRLSRYPIPELRLPRGEGRTLLDVGCNWGRWTLAAARAGFRPVGVDPSLDAALAGRRVAHQLGLDAAFVVADGRSLPFMDGAFDAAYSYSVLQHFSREDARTTVSEMGRVTRDGGTVLVQMPNVFGLRQLYNQAKETVLPDRGRFRVRRWRPEELVRTFEERVGPSRLVVDGFFSLNAQPTDIDLLSPAGAVVVRASEALRRLARWLPPLVHVADSVFVESTKRPGGSPGSVRG